MKKFMSQEELDKLIVGTGLGAIDDIDDHEEMEVAMDEKDEKIKALESRIVYLEKMVNMLKRVLRFGA